MKVKIITRRHFWLFKFKGRRYGYLPIDKVFYIEIPEYKFKHENKVRNTILNFLWDNQIKYDCFLILNKNYNEDKRFNRKQCSECSLFDRYLLPPCIKDK